MMNVNDANGKHEFNDEHDVNCPGCDDGSMMVYPGECAGCVFEENTSCKGHPGLGHVTQYCDGSCRKVSVHYTDHPGHTCNL